MRGSRADARLMVKAREQLGGISQQEMGELLGMTQGAVGHIEQGRTKLNGWVRRDLNRLLVQAEAARMAAGSEPLVCLTMSTLAAADYLTHLEGCPACSARAIRTRAILTFVDR